VGRLAAGLAAEQGCQTRRVGDSGLQGARWGEDGALGVPEAMGTALRVEARRTRLRSRSGPCVCRRHSSLCAWKETR
jgi:hypothetical protein